MKDSFGIPSELDRLLPAERLRDPKSRGVHQEASRRGREGKKKPPRAGDSETLEEQTDETPEGGDRNPGKILDILI